MSVVLSRWTAGRQFSILFGMCGRVHVKRSLADMVRKFGFADAGEVSSLANQFPKWNGAPTQTYPIIIVDELERRSSAFVSGRWGFVPSSYGSLKQGPTPFNARAETVKTNGWFRNAYRSGRCLMPIDGYFEWRDIHGTGKDKQPYAIAMKSGEPFALASIWQAWTDKATGETLRTFTVITCEPNSLMAQIHDRMPVILDPADYDRWLFDDDPADLMKPFDPDRMTMWKIGRQVSNWRNNSPDILEPDE